MIKLLFTSLTFILFSPVLFAQEFNTEVPYNEGQTDSPLCGGVERWAVKVLTDAAAAQVNYTPKPTTLDSLINIPTTPSTTAPRMAGIEFQSYVFPCNITIKKNEDDNDYHLVLKSGNQTMIGEVPDPVCAAAASSAHVNEFIAARNWVNSHIGTGAVANVNIAPVEITGISFVDPPHGQTGRAPNGMEIHPILDIRFAGSTGINYDETQSTEFRVSINPPVFSESTTLHITTARDMIETCRLEIFSVSGNRMNDIDLPLSGSKEINYTLRRNGLTAGMYICRIRINGEISHEERIIIL